MRETAHKLITRIKESSFCKSVIVLSLGHFLALFINLISYPILSRLYSSDAYGEFGIVVSTASIILGFSGLALGPAIMTAKTDEESALVFRVCFVVQFIIAAIISLVFILFMDFHRVFSTSFSYPLAVLYMFCYINFSNLLTLLSIYANRYKLDKVLFINPLLGAICMLGIAVPLGLLQVGSAGLFAGNLGVLVVCSMHVLARINPFIKKVSIRNIIYVLKQYKKFVLFQTPAYALHSFSLQLPNQMFGSVFGFSALGHYTMCDRMLGVPASLLGGPISTVYFRTVSGELDRKKMADFTLSLIVKIMLAAFVPFVIMSVFGAEIFMFVLGAQWALAGEFASVLSLQYILLFCCTCTAYCRVALDGQGINTVFSGLYLATTFLAITAGIYLYGTILGAIVCFAIGNSIFQILNMAANFYCLKKNLGKYLWFAVVYSLAFSAVCWGLKQYLAM